MRGLSFGILSVLGCGDTKASLTVNNDAPELSILAPVDGTTVNEYDVVEFRGMTTDFEDLETDLIVMWSSSIDGLLDSTPPDASGSLYFGTNTLNPGTHLITLTVSDTQGLSSNTSVEVTVTDQEDDPTIEVRSPVENSAEEGVDVEFEVYVNDVQDDPSTLSVSFSSSLDGEFCTPTADSIGIALCTAQLSIGMHELTFIVEDTHGNIGQTLQLFSILSSSDVDNDGDGLSEDDGDCNDENPNISPNTVETLNGLDDDCDGRVDNGTTGFDDDGDGYSELEGDCDDLNEFISPVATEDCDGVDQDCDGIIDNATDCYDDDGDGFSEVDGDCDDNNLSANPLGLETLDGIDNDCDGSIDEGTIHFDDDGDCYCEQLPCYGSVNNICNPAGILEGDCDDTDISMAPSATEVCDGVDQDCDGVVDNNPINPLTWYADMDADGYGDASQTLEECTQPLNHVANYSDCDDTDPSTSPNGLESCDGVDNDCDGTVDEAASIDAPDWYMDLDADGFGDASLTQRSCSQPTGYVSNMDDCDDSQSTSAPSSIEVCDGVDNNCDGQIDEVGALGGLLYYPDGDGDTYGDASGTPIGACSLPVGYVQDATDCDDNDDDVHPTAVENCDNEDNDCNGIVDDNTVDGFVYYADVDGDGFGDPTTMLQDCTLPQGMVTQAGDCDDSDVTTFSGATEICDGIDNNCNGVLDDGLVLQDFWLDSDGDTWGDGNTTPIQACSAPNGMIDTDGDCDDTNSSVYPGAQELCLDGLDNDCSGDADCDDWGACRDIEATCWVCGDGYNDVNEDCDDGNFNNGDGCDANCQLEIDLSGLYTSWTLEGREVYVFKSVSNTPLSNYATFCEDRGLNWYEPLSQSDAQSVITNCYNLDTYHTWIITYNTTTSSRTWGGYSVTTDGGAGGSGGSFSSSGFSAIRKWGSSYCEPDYYNVTNCWDSGHSYDWLICEAP